MDDRRRTLAAVTILFGIIVLVGVTIAALISSNKILSPVPEESAIRIIIVSPTPTIFSASPTGSLAKPSPTKKSQ